MFEPKVIGELCFLCVSIRRIRSQRGQSKFSSFGTKSCDSDWTVLLCVSIQVDVQFADGIEDIDHSYYTHSNVWDLKETYAKRTDKKYPCCPETYPDLTFHLKLQRRRSYYSYMLVLPAIIIALLVPVMFLMPVGRPEKFYMGRCFCFCFSTHPAITMKSSPLVH